MRRLALPLVLLMMAVVIPLALLHQSPVVGDRALPGPTAHRGQQTIPVETEHVVVARPGTHRISGPRTVLA